MDEESTFINTWALQEENLTDLAILGKHNQACMGDEMGIEQFQRGMRHRIKYIQLRLRLQVRHLARHGKMRKAVGPAWEATPPSRIKKDWPDGSINASSSPETAAMPLPTLRRSAGQKTSE